MSPYIPGILAVAFLASAGLNKYQAVEIKGARAELTLAQSQRDDFRDAANVNASAVQKVKDALDACHGLLMAGQSDASKAIADQKRQNETLAARLASARAETNKLLGGQCKAWAEQPACADVAMQ